jgi:hypothetical protein
VRIATHVTPRRSCHPVNHAGVGDVRRHRRECGRGSDRLLFVAVSIKVDAIAASSELRNRSAQTLGLFVTVLFIAVLLAIPGQSIRVMGAELIALTAFSGTVL